MGKKNINTPWTSAEVKKLKNMAPNKTVRDIADNLNRSDNDVKSKMKELEITPFKTPRKWEESEDMLLRALCPEDIDSALEEMPHRTRRACYFRSIQLGIKYPKFDNIPWTDKEREDLYHADGDPAFAKKLIPYRSKLSIIQEMVRLNICDLSYCPNFWTEEETNILREHAGENPLDIMRMVPRHSKTAVINKMQKLGLEYQKNNPKLPVVWTEEEEQFLLENYGKVSIQKMASQFGKSVGTIAKKAKELGLHMRRKNSWTEAELEILRENCSKEKLAKVHELLPGRTPGACFMKAKQLGIAPKTSPSSPWTKEEVDLLAQMNNDNIDEIVEKIPNHSKAACIARAKKLGFLKPREYRTSTGWSPEELDVLKKHYEKKGAIGVAEMLPKKTPIVVFHKAQELGLECHHGM